MEIAVIGDVHFNIRQGSEIFQKNTKKFFDLVLFPTLKSRNINTIFQSGDIFDSRRSTHSQGLQNSKECFFDKVVSNNMVLHMILGNHDLFFRESLEINTPELVLGEYIQSKHVHVYSKPTTVNFDGLPFDFIPWICEGNTKEVFNFVNKTKSKYALGHLELVGFEMSKGHFCEHGMDSDLFKTYSVMMSGHYHRKSKDKNIVYVGNPTQDSWDAVDEIKGFHIFNTETKELEFIPNPYNLFERIEYDDTKKLPLIDVTDKYVKIIVKKSSDTKKLESYVESLSLHNPVDIKVIENMAVESALEVDLTLEQLESEGMDTVTFVSDYTINSNSDLTTYQKDLIKSTYKNLFEQSKEVI